ncbi:MAG: threonine--tRNA ligase, partial [Actinobacteria bacterium]|nr:threonine--tRNA ligase [Actinomycetota bacterium]
FPPMELDGTKYYLRAMNCPHHHKIFDAEPKSYKDLPFRIAEYGTCYRYEQSGELFGLMRVRCLHMNDAHIYCTREQMQDELKSLLSFVLDLLRDYGLDDFFLELSTRNPEKSVGTDEDWDAATAALAEAAAASGLELVPDPGGAAFYGPKISVQARDAIGRSWQMSTIQLDFQLPQRFELEYQASDGTRQRPIMIHRALFGSIERFFAVLTEHYAGAFPPWLAPVQAVGIPVAAEFDDYLLDVAEQMRARGLRVEVDTSDDRMQKKIRTAQKQKIPVMLIAGEEDRAAGAVSFRFRDGSQRNGVPIAEAIAYIATLVDSRAQV